MGVGDLEPPPTPMHPMKPPHSQYSLAMDEVQEEEEEKRGEARSSPPSNVQCLNPPPHVPIGSIW